MFNRGVKLFGIALAAFLIGACSDDDMTGMDDPEETTFQVRVENVSTVYDFHDSGAFATPEGSAQPGPAGPGSAYTFRLTAAPGHALFFATMFVQSNDLFYAPDEDGIALYDDQGNPRTGDVTDEVLLWDAGTEMNEEPGLGGNQAPRQAGPDTGPADDNANVRVAEDEFGNLPAVDAAIRVTLTHMDGGEFLVRIGVLDGAMIQTSDGGQAPVVLAPGVFSVGSGSAPLFTSGSPDSGEGLEELAEDGVVGPLTSVLEANTGLTSPLAPGAWALHASGEVMFSSGMPDRGQGLEALAEDGDPSGLAASLGGDANVIASGAFNTPEGADSPAPIFPGEAYTFEVTAEPGQFLSLATMLVQTNDLFYAPSDMGLKLFDGSSARSGDLTDEFLLWDAGTEVNEIPGVGADQAPRQAGPDTGTDEGGTVRVVNDAFVYPEVESVIRVTITPNS